MNTDAAEAILLGHFAVNEKLGWSSERAGLKDLTTHSSYLHNHTRFFKPPLVERFTNGNVVLPKEKKVG